MPDCLHCGDNATKQVKMSRNSAWLFTCQYCAEDYNWWIVEPISEEYMLNDFEPEEMLNDFEVVESA